MIATYSEWNSPDYYWDFSNYCYLNFSEAINFADAPIQNVLNDSSLVGYWDMNVGSGDIMPDLSGNGNNGIIYGASWVDGKFGKALSFDGQNNYVEIPYNSSLDNFQAITISFWMYPTMWGDGYYRHVIDKGWQTEGALLVYLDRSSQNLNFVTRDSVGQKLSSFMLPSLNTWYFVTCVFQKGLPNKIYVNATKGKDSSATANESLILENGIRVAQNTNDFAGHHRRNLHLQPCFS